MAALTGGCRFSAGTVFLLASGASSRPETNFILSTDYRGGQNELRSLTGCERMRERCHAIATKTTIARGARAKVRTQEAGIAPGVPSITPAPRGGFRGR